MTLGHTGSVEEQPGERNTVHRVPHRIRSGRFILVSGVSAAEDKISSKQSDDAKRYIWDPCCTAGVARHGGVHRANSGAESNNRRQLPLPGVTRMSRRISRKLATPIQYLSESAITLHLFRIANNLHLLLQSIHICFKGHLAVFPN